MRNWILVSETKQASKHPVLSRSSAAADRGGGEGDEPGLGLRRPLRRRGSESFAAGAAHERGRRAGPGGASAPATPRASCCPRG